MYKCVSVSVCEWECVCVCVCECVCVQYSTNICIGQQFQWLQSYLKNGTIFDANISAVLNPWE